MRLGSAPVPAAAPALHARGLVRDDRAVRGLVRGRRELGRVDAERAHLRTLLGERPQRVEHDREPRIAVRILGALPLELRAHVRGREEAVAVHLDVERVAVVPPHELLLAGLLHGLAERDHVVDDLGVVREHACLGALDRQREAVSDHERVRVAAVAVRAGARAAEDEPHDLHGLAAALDALLHAGVRVVEHLHGRGGRHDHLLEVLGVLHPHLVRAHLLQRVLVEAVRRVLRRHSGRRAAAGTLGVHVHL